MDCVNLSELREFHFLINEKTVKVFKPNQSTVDKLFSS